VAQEQSAASPHRSRFGGGWLSNGQFLAEGMVARKARYEKTELPLKFWEQERWKRDFLLQLRHANSLLKVYSFAAIIAALKSKKGANLFSLGAQFILDPLVRTEQERLDRRENAAEAKAQADPKPELPPATAEPPVTEQPRPAFVRPNALSKLKGL